MAEKSGGRKSIPPESSPQSKSRSSSQRRNSSKEKTPSPRRVVEPSDSVSERRNSVLEGHGYKVGKAIGTGSYANVKLAESKSHGGIVAIKIVSKFYAPPDYLQKFLPREIQVVKGLSHPNLIKFHQAIETTHRVYIIMEYAEKGSLLDIIREEGYIDEPRARGWYKELIDAVEYCHSQGVVHRDVKCENLLMDVEYHLKLSDFGFARGDMGTQESDYVMSDTFCGSYAYASPEILKGIPYKPQYSDIWSTGVVLYATVLGRLPFDDTNYSTLIKQVQKPVTFPREPSISGECKSLIRKILAPLKERLKIDGIRQEPWMLIDDNNPPEPTPQKIEVKEPGPPKGILTTNKRKSA